MLAEQAAPSLRFAASRGTFQCKLPLKHLKEVLGIYSVAQQSVLNQFPWSCVLEHLILALLSCQSVSRDAWLASFLVAKLPSTYIVPGHRPQSNACHWRFRMLVEHAVLQWSVATTESRPCLASLSTCTCRSKRLRCGARCLEARPGGVLQRRSMLSPCRRRSYLPSRCTLPEVCILRR